MLILGIDPGTATTGFGFIDVSNISGGVKIKVGEHGLIETRKELEHKKRYVNIYNTLSRLIEVQKPDVMAIEKVFFATNAKTAIRVGQAQGVMLLAAGFSKLDVVEYAPGTIKKVITGSGRAKKREMQECVVKILGRLEGGKIRENKARRITKTHIDNVIDAFAIALTHANKVFEKFEIDTNGSSVLANANSFEIGRIDLR